MGDLVTPDDLAKWIPGEVTVDSAPLGWQGLRVRGYRYRPQDVPIPGMRDYIVAYQGWGDDHEPAQHGRMAKRAGRPRLRVPSHACSTIPLALE